ncbi:MAG: adenosylmethionine--8-amino-7-oxononanoate transaminase [Gemmataceae bacterium]
MTGFVIVGTDTDAGKTAFSACLLARRASKGWCYWKPVETGESDTEKIRRLVPGATVFDPLARFAEPVAPMLAAKREGRPMPGVDAILAAIPKTDQPLLIETFGGPLSPLIDGVLQLELIRAFNLPVILVASSAVGAVGRTLAAARALEDVEITAVVLMGPPDSFAVEQLQRHLPGVEIVSQSMPTAWTPDGIGAVAIDWHPRAPLRELSDAPQRETVWHPYTPLRGADDPLPVVSAEREFLTLADGRRIIDGISSWWTILHGHREPAIMQAIRDATRRLDHVIFAGATHPDAEQLAEHLLGAMPWPAGGRVFYSDNGSTAVEVALKMAYQFHCHRGEPGRTLFIGFENGYHGDTFGAMSVGRDPLFFGRFEPLLFRAMQVKLDANHLDQMLAKHGHETAAVILEPLVQGAGGMRMHSPRELAGIAEVCRRHAVPLIADEVMTGFGRTGSLFAFQQANIAPEFVCLSKGITGGVLPLAATLAAPEIVRAFDTADRSRTFFHGHSFTANPIACAAAVASWKRLATGRGKQDTDRIEAFWRARLKHPRLRTSGLIAAIELELPGGYLAEAGTAMRRAALEEGVLLRPLGNVLYAMPPFCTSNESLERISVAMERAVAVAMRSSGAV